MKTRSKRTYKKSPKPTVQQKQIDIEIKKEMEDKATGIIQTRSRSRKDGITDAIQDVNRNAIISKKSNNSKETAIACDLEKRCESFYRK